MWNEAHFLWKPSEIRDHVRRTLDNQGTCLQGPVPLLSLTNSLICTTWSAFSAFSTPEKNTWQLTSPWKPENLRKERRGWYGENGETLAINASSGSQRCHFHQLRLWWSVACFLLLFVWLCLALFFNINLIKWWAIAKFFTPRNIVYKIEWFYLPKKCGL